MAEDDGAFGAAAERCSPLAVATKLMGVLTAAAKCGFASFPQWLEAFTRHCWKHPRIMGNLVMPARGDRRRGTVGWMTFPGGSSRRDGDRWRMYRHYVGLLEGVGLLETLSPPDERAKRCGVWRVRVPVPEGPHGPGEAWRIVREMAASAARPEAALMEAVRKHAGKCTPHLRSRPKDARAWAAADHSPRNRHMLDQVRAGVLLAVRAADAKCTLVTNWPDADRADSVDVAVFRWASKSLAMAVNCGIGKADDPEAAALLHVLESQESRHPDAEFLYITLWDPDLGLVAKLEDAGAKVATVYPKRVRPRRPPARIAAREDEHGDKDGRQDEGQGTP
jgi:hypothetical protein